MVSERIDRSKDYKRRLPVQDRNKLFIPRDITGAPTLAAPAEDAMYGSEVHELVRTLQRELGSQKSFIGIVPTGSVMRGHRTENSDIDLVVLYEYTAGNSEGKKLMSIYKDEVTHLRERGVLKHHVHENMVGLTVEAIEKYLSKDLSEPDMKDGLDHNNLFLAAVVALCSPIVGPRVEEYRDIMRAHMQRLPHDKMMSALMELASMAMQLESNSDAKRRERIPELSRNSKEVTEDARVKMWFTRIVISLGLGERTS